METILYDGMLCEVLKHSTMPIVLLQYNGKTNFQKMMSVKDYEALKAGKKKATDKWTLYWNEKAQCEGVYAICVKKRMELEKHSQFKNGNFKIK